MPLFLWRLAGAGSALLQRLPALCQSPESPKRRSYAEMVSQLSLPPSLRLTSSGLLCEAVPPHSSKKKNDDVSQSSPDKIRTLQADLDKFCDTYNIPANARPAWDTEQQRITFQLPAGCDVDSITARLAEFRSITPKGGTPSSSSSSFNTVVMRTDANQQRQRTRVFIQTQRTPRELAKKRNDTSNMCYSTTTLEFIRPRNEPDQNTTVTLAKDVGDLDDQDIHCVELALYLAYVNPLAARPTVYEDWTPGFLPFHDQRARRQRLSTTRQDPFEMWALESRGSGLFDTFGFFNDPFLQMIQSLFTESAEELFWDTETSDGTHSQDASTNVSQSTYPHQPKHEHHSLSPHERDHIIKRRLENMGALVYLPSDTRQRLEWDDLAGYDDAKSRIEETLLLGLEHPEVFDKVTETTRGRQGESNRPRMILFNGPPGTGKTSSARIIASQVKLPLIYVSLECIVSKWFGESEKNLGKIFDMARELGQVHNGCIIFVDEIDSLASSRDDQALHEASRRMLSVGTSFEILLRRLDGFDTQHDRTILICATNRERDLDEAFRSRVDMTVSFPLPNQEGREKILRRYARHLSDDDIKTIAAATGGLSGRNIRDFCQTAERRWVAHILRKHAHEKSYDSIPVPPPPPTYYLEAAEDKQRQQL